MGISNFDITTDLGSRTLITIAINLKIGRNDWNELHLVFLVDSDYFDFLAFYAIGSLPFHSFFLLDFLDFGSWTSLSGFNSIMS